MGIVEQSMKYRKSVNPVLLPFRISFFQRFRSGIIGEGLLIAFGQGAQAIAMLVGVRLLSELVSPDIYGEVTLFMGVVVLGRQVFGFPFLQAALRFYPDAVNNNFVYLLRNTIKSYLFRIVGSYTVLYLIIGFGYTVFTNYNISYYLFVLSSGLLCCEVACVLETDLYNAARMQSHFVFVQVSNSWLRPLFAVLAVFIFGANSVSIISGYLAATAVVVICLYVFPIKKIGIRQSEKVLDSIPKFKQDICQYALPLMPLAAFGWVSTFGDRYLIGALFDAEQVGIYAVAYSLMSLPFAMVQAVVERTLRPIYFEAISAGEEKRADQYFRIWINSVFYICFAGVLIVYFFHDDIAKLCLAEKYHTSARLMPWIALGYFFLTMSSVFEKPCFAYKKTIYVLLIQGAGAIFCLLVTIPFLIYYGIIGAAMSVPVYFFMQLCASIVAYRCVIRKNEMSDQCL
jgi:O-antigen/teichoic acid export membrane protein